MKRAKTKKVKNWFYCAIGNDAVLGQSQPKVKRRIFRTSAALVGLTVSVSTPNLLLVQAGPLPESNSSQSTPIQNALSETVQIVPATMPLPAATPQQIAVSSPYNTARLSAVKKVAAPSYNQPTLSSLVPPSAPTTNIIQAQPSNHPPVKQDLRTILRQYQQTTGSELQGAVTVAPPANQTNYANGKLEATEKTEVSQSQVIEILPAQTNTSSSLPTVQNHLTSEANSGWTAKQRLLIDRLKNQENPTPNNPEVLQVPNNINLGSVSQPPLKRSVGAIAAKKIEPPLKQSANEAPVIPTTSNESVELAAPPLADKVIELPEAAPTKQNLVTTPLETTQPLSANTAATKEQLEQSSNSALGLPKTPVDDRPEQGNTSTSEAPQVSAQDTPVEVTTKKSTPAIEIKPSVNEPIIVSSATSEYQVKPGDNLTNIASEHRISPPEIANFNKLQNPDLLLVNQKIKIPTLTSIKIQANVAVLPPIEKAGTVKDTNSLSPSMLPSENELAIEPKVISTKSPEAIYTGMGGSIPGEEVEAKPLPPEALNNLQAQYAQTLQSDVHKLKQKYSANISSPRGPASAIQGLKKSSATLGDEPVNPDFRVAQTFQDLKPVPQKRLLNSSNYAAPAKVRGRVATAPGNVDNFNESFPSQQVIPELPPLDPAKKYLPQPNGVPFNGYIWPARGALTSPYGYRWGRMHRGIDIAAPVGTPIFAAAPGVVIKSGWNKGGYGNLVDIQHADGTLTRYAHNYRLLVRPGQFVDQGQQISLMGSTGRSTGPHLHFELHPGGKGAVNPIALLPKVR